MQMVYREKSMAGLLVGIEMMLKKESRAKLVFARA